MPVLSPWKGRAFVLRVITPRVSPRLKMGNVRLAGSLFLWHVAVSPSPDGQLKSGDNTLPSGFLLWAGLEEDRSVVYISVQFAFLILKLKLTS